MRSKCGQPGNTCRGDTGNDDRRADNSALVAAGARFGVISFHNLITVLPIPANRDADAVGFAGRQRRWRLGHIRNLEPGHVSFANLGFQPDREPRVRRSGRGRRHWVVIPFCAHSLSLESGNYVEIPRNKAGAYQS